MKFEVGDTIIVDDGPFEGKTGLIEAIDKDAGKLRVVVTVFGRATPIELEFWQVEPL